MKRWLLICCCTPVVLGSLVWDSTAQAQATDNTDCPVVLPVNDQSGTTISESLAQTDTVPDLSTATLLNVEQLNIITHPIFDESDPDTIWLHRFANWLHIETKAEIIAERLPFAAGQQVSMTELAETERIVRKLPYIRDAKVSVIAPCQQDDPNVIQVESWDNWSLIPTISFGRKGGKNKGSIGIKEDNLLGLGIKTRIKYNSDDQRTGYQFTLQTATPMLMPYSTLLLDFQDNDDGNLINVEFDRPFYHAGTETMYLASYLSDDKIVDIYQNGDTRNTFANQSHRYELATGWQFDSSLLLSQRFKVGIVDEKDRFFPDPFVAPSQQPFLPEDRHFQYVWAGIESLHRDFRVMSDIYLIDQAEDINLGLHYDVRLGVDFSAGHSGLGYRLDASVNKGWQVNDGLLLAWAKLSGELNQSDADHYLFSANGEYFKRYNHFFGVYGRLTAAAEKNPYLDKPQNVGDDSGVRGYPLQYQHGDHSVSGSVEARLYTGYNLYKILDVGMAAFVDAGRAWGGFEDNFNETDKVLSSVGFGARLYSNRASHQSVIHIDLVKPLTSSDNVDSWEWRMQVKESF